MRNVALGTPVSGLPKALSCYTNEVFNDHLLILLFRVMQKWMQVYCIFLMIKEIKS